ncbi:MAG: DUF2281 domain-containing protein [Phormidesmis sp.]
MSDLSRLQEDVTSLPEEAQQTIIDFVSFLKQRHRMSQHKSPRLLTFDDQPFVGMWSDRPEMQNSIAWVRQIRTQQWRR